MPIYNTFPLLDAYAGAMLGADLSSIAPNQIKIVESPRRLRPEKSYGFVHALWWVHFEDGRSIVSVPPGSGDAVEDIIGSRHKFPGSVFDGDLPERLRDAIGPALDSAGVGPFGPDRHHLAFACNATTLCSFNAGMCRRLTNDSFPIAEGLQFPTYSFPDGIVYGGWADGRVVSVAYAHRTEVMEDQVADLGVETAPAYRRKGFAHAAVASVVDHVAQNGGEAIYKCNPANEASIATARSVGFVPWYRSLALAANAKLT